MDMNRLARINNLNTSTREQLQTDWIVKICDAFDDPVVKESLFHHMQDKYGQKTDAEFIDFIRKVEGL